MRYKPINARQRNDAQMSAKFYNQGEIDSKDLKKGGKDVLTEANFTNNPKESDLTKVPSLMVVKELLKDFKPEDEGLSKNISLMSDMQNLKREKTELHAKTETLLDPIITPEILYHEVRQLLIRDLGDYNLKFDNLIVYMTKLLDMNEITDDDYDKFDNLVAEYTAYLSNLSKTIQLATQTVMTVKSNDVLDKANENMNQIASQITYKLEIESTNGPFYRKGFIDTDLSAKIYKGKDEITEQFKDIQFRWSRKSKNSNSDEFWNMSAKKTKNLHISNSDYEVGGCKFICTLYDEQGKAIISSD